MGEIFISNSRIQLRFLQRCKQQYQMYNNIYQISQKVVSFMSKVNFYIKMSTQLNLSTPNPILLLQPQQTIYKRNRKISETIFEIDNDKNAILFHFSFSKIFSLKNISNTINLNKFLQISILLDIKQFKASLRKDSIMAIYDLIGILQYIYQDKKFKEPISEQNSYKSEIVEYFPSEIKNKNFSIFQDQPSDYDIVDQIIESKNFEIKFSLNQLEIKLFQGCVFAPEVFHIEDDDYKQPEIEQIQSFESITGYECYHIKFANSNSRILEQEEQKIDSNENSGYLMLVMQNLKIFYAKEQQETLKLILANLYIQDEVPNTRFNILIAKESLSQLQGSNCQLDNSIEFTVQKYRKIIKQPNQPELHLKVNVKIHPLRVCIYGGTFEFIYFFFATDIKKQNIKLEYQRNCTLRFTKRFEQLQLKSGEIFDAKRISIQQKVLIEMAHEIGYKVQFRNSKLKVPIYVEQIFIEQIKLVLTYDGSGIQTNNIKKLFLKIASYDHLEINFQAALIKEIYFLDDKELARLLFEQYQKHVDQQIFQKLFLQLKAVQNITNIISGFKNLVSNIIEKGIFVGFSAGSVPLAQAIADELLYLAKKPIDVCETVTDGFSMNSIFKTVGKKLDSVLKILFLLYLKQFYGCNIPSEFLKRKQ